MVDLSTPTKVYKGDLYSFCLIRLCQTCVGLAGISRQGIFQVGHLDTGQMVDGLGVNSVNLTNLTVNELSGVIISNILKL